jgi:large subunit ribosomal protein L18
MRPSTKAEYRERRHLRVRRKVRGTAERPRMSVFFSGRHIQVQFIDDLASATLAAASTQSPAFEARGQRNTVDTARKLGAHAARVAKEKGIGMVVFDRGGFAYRGRVKALAEAARAEGLQF